MFNNSVRRPLVCLFDSGIGGLNLLGECVRRIPCADYVYVADNFNVPYGNHPPAEISRLVFSAFEKIGGLHPDAAVVACNTVTAGFIAALRARYPFPVVGVEPALKQACAHGGRYLVLATCSTCRSKSFSSLVKRYGNSAVVAPCPSLAQEIENNIFSDDLNFLADGLPRGKFSSVVLGCTHYIFIKKAIEKKYGCPVFDGMAGTADHLAEILGISDHFCERAANIAFYGGNTAKNRAVFSKFEKF